MKYRATRPFGEAYAQLPPRVKAREAFERFRRGVEHPPFHPSLRIRKVRGYSQVWEGHLTRGYVFTFH